MLPYRFSPIENIDKLLEAMKYIHINGHQVCRNTLGCVLPVAGNIGVFSHFLDEYEALRAIQKELVDEHLSWNGKYFKLYSPIHFEPQLGISPTDYSYLYIRKPEASEMKVGDIDFYLSKEEYEEFKEAVLAGKYSHGVSVFERPDLDLIRLSDPTIDVSAFVGSYDLEEIVNTFDQH